MLPGAGPPPQRTAPHLWGRRHNLAGRHADGSRVVRAVDDHVGEVRQQLGRAQGAVALQGGRWAGRGGVGGLGGVGVGVGGWQDGAGGQAGDYLCLLQQQHQPLVEGAGHQHLGLLVHDMHCPVMSTTCTAL